MTTASRPNGAGCQHAGPALGSRIQPELLAQSLQFQEKVTDPQKQREVIQEAYRNTGHLLDKLEDIALLVDTLCMDFPIVGASKGFCDLTGYKLEDVLGQNCRMMLEGVPSMTISRSSRKNIKDYCSMCQVEGLTEISEVTAVQPNSRADGSHFVNFFMLGLCRVQRRHFILGVQVPLGEGLFVQLSQAEVSKVTEQTHVAFKRIRKHLGSPPAHTSDEGLEAAPAYLRHAIVSQPNFAFFAERLQDHCLLINNGFTAIRREPQDLAFNCLVFGDRPVRRTADGLRFTVHVDEVTPAFTGLPVLGFTRRQPVDSKDLYPGINKCLGASVLIGACGEAFVRDKREHFKMGFKQPPSDEIQTWTLQPGIPPHKRSPPANIAHGDLLHCIYTWDGRVILMKNENVVIEFDVQRPIEEHTDYYAVVDVCFSAYSLTIVPTTHCGAGLEAVPEAEGFDRNASSGPEEAIEETLSTLPAQVSAAFETTPSEGVAASLADSLFRQPSNEGVDVGDRFSRAVNDILVKQSIKEIVASCKFMVTIADPRGKDCPLIAVSEEFENMTGFKRSEILGVNCRFLNQGCDMDPADLASLRISSKTGAPFTAVIPNRKKSGELFLNLLDLRGLTVARNPVTKEELWFLIGIQADVTDMAEDEFPRDHLAELQMVADGIRMGIKKELSRMAMTGAAATDDSLPDLMQSRSPQWQLLEDPRWRPGAALGMRSPDDSPCRDVLVQAAQMAAASAAAPPRCVPAPPPAARPGRSGLSGLQRAFDVAPPPATTPPQPPPQPPPRRSKAPAILEQPEPVPAQASAAFAPEKTPEPQAAAAMAQPISRGEALLLASVVVLTLGGFMVMATRKRI